MSRVRIPSLAPRCSLHINALSIALAGVQYFASNRFSILAKSFWIQRNSYRIRHLQRHQRCRASLVRVITEARAGKKLTHLGLARIEQVASKLTLNLPPFGAHFLSH